MYRKQGETESFLKYIDRLLDKGGDCYKILNALDYKITEEFLFNLDIIVAVNHINNLKYIDKSKFEQLEIDSKVAYKMYYYACNVKGANKERIRQALIALGDTYYSSLLEPKKTNKIVKVHAEEKNINQEID